MPVQTEPPQRSLLPITVSCATRFHSDYLAHHLWHAGRLNRALTGHTFRRFTSRVELPVDKIGSTLPFVYLSAGLARLNGHRLTRLNNWLDEAAIYSFDASAAKFINDRQALVCWSRSSLKQMQNNRLHGGLNVIERVGSDTRFQHAVLSAEYDRLGLKSPQKPTSFVLEREAQEYALADVVLCPSNHVVQSFQGMLGVTLELNRYGVSEQRFNVSTEHTKRSKTFEILYVGTIGVRKGCAYLLEAAQHFRTHPDVRFKLIGPLEPSFEPVFAKYRQYVEWLGPIANSELPEHYRTASVFLFPSLDEGMAYVQIEAMACGLPLIATFSAGADVLIQDGVNGFLVNSHNADVLIERITKLLDEPELLDAMKVELRKPVSRYTWAEHAKGVIRHVDTLCTSPGQYGKSIVSSSIQRI